MARNERNHLKIISVLGFKKPGPVQAINVVAPTIETTKNFDDISEQPYLGTSTVVTKIIETNALNTFTFITFNTVTDLVSQSNLIIYTKSNTQTIEISNLGNTTLNITDIGESPFNGAKAVFHTPTALTISSGNTASIVVGYYSDQAGTYFNYLDIISDSGLGPYRIPTQQIVGDIFSINIEPTNRISTSTEIGETVIHEYSIVPVLNNESRPDILLDFTAALSSVTDNWSVTTGNNSFTVKFFNLFGTTTGTYQNTILIDTEYQNISAADSATSQVNVDIDYERFENIGSWISAYSFDNSAIGISYDILDGNKFLTIGVGSGVDDSPEIGSGGYNFINTDFLGFQGRYPIKPFAYWKEVYVFPITGEIQELFSKEYLVKSEIDETDQYGYYFGDNHALGSLFTVKNDSEDNLTIIINNIRELKNQTSFDRTLENISRSFYYYSTIDRLNQLANFTPEGKTQYLLGIDKLGNIKTSLRSYI